MWDAQLDETQARIKTARRNNNLRYADNATLVAEIEKELKGLLIRMKEKNENAGLKLALKKKKKTKIMASSTITSWQIEGEKVKQCRFYFLMLQNHCGRWL